MTRREDNISLRIVKAELACTIEITSSVVDDSGRGGCVATRMSAAGRLASGPEKNLGSSSTELVPKKPAVICVAAGENVPSPKAAVRPTDRRAAAESSPLQSGTAAQQGVSRGQDPAAVGNDWSAAAGKFQLSPGWCFMDLPTRAGVKPALGNKAVEE